MINSRKDIRDFILDLENRFPVNDWQFDNLHIWPILRIRLFFFLIRKTEFSNSKSAVIPTKKQENKKSALGNRVDKLLSIFNYCSMILSLRSLKYLFVAHDNHRVEHLGKRFNRFFDVLIDRYHIEKYSMYLEPDHQDKKTLYRGKSVYSYTKALKGYLFLRKFKSHDTLHFEGARFSEFLEFLSQNELTKDFALTNSKEKLTRWYNYKAKPRLDFFSIILAKFNPLQVSVLCYYSEDIMMLLVIANRLGIKTVEMQHGPQSDVHMCYSNWNSIPAHGYDVLPRIFWSWDENSSKIMKRWTNDQGLYTSIVAGHPWFDYWKNQTEMNTSFEYILYSLQPDPVTLDKLFHPGVVQLIKTTKEKWFIRLHPRQLGQLPIIKQHLADLGILNLVVLEQATNDPLPLILSNAKIHVTHYSGTLIEAASLGIKTILFSPIGVHSFSQYINDGAAVYLDTDDAHLKEKFYLELENASTKRENDNAKETIQDLF